MKHTILYIIFFIGKFSFTFSEPVVSYVLSMPEPNTHYFEVEIQIKDFDQEYCDVSMPVWTPGSYLIREFARNVISVKSYDLNNNLIESNKIDKNTWRIHNKGLRDFKVIYKVYAFELSVRTSYLDESHGFITGTSVFMYLDDYLELPVTLTINPHKNFKKISTALPIQKGPNVFRARDYHQLVDCPIEIGNHELIRFEVEGVTHEIAMYGEADYDPVKDKFVEDVTSIIKSLSLIFGENPNEYYLFIIHHVDRGGGALEHENSTVIKASRLSYTPGSDYQNFLSLIAHEYFHIWNVKRIKPESFIPYDYDREMYTDLLWMFEGFTSYYDELILKRVGIIAEDEYISRLNGAINTIEKGPGISVMSVAEASFDAWIEFYRPDENSINTTTSYYTKGNVIGAMIDLIIINATDGKYCLDDVFHRLYNQYYKSGKGITSEILKNELENISGRSFDDFFKKYIFGTEPIPYEEYLDYAGLGIYDYLSGTENVFLGTGLGEEGGRTIVKTVLAGSSAEKAGIQPGDEIIAINQIRMDAGEVFEVINRHQVGDTINIMISRFGKIEMREVELIEDPRNQYKIYKLSEPSESQKKVLSRWLR